ncbi:MAG: MaoC family dehydratase [Actinomycetota bacterium]
MSWPQALHTVIGPFAEPRVRGAAEGMGAHGPTTQRLIHEGIVSPDLMCGMTLFLLARQRRREQRSAASGSERSAPDDDADRHTSDDDHDGGDAPPPRRTKASPIEGGVWVREQFTIHRPLAVADAFVIDGAATGRFVRKGRRYGVTISRSQDSAGRLAATNLTCGLLSYHAGTDEDSIEGQSLENTPSPSPDYPACSRNPHLDRLEAVQPGDTFGGDPLRLSLAMMAARDTTNPDNPIHSDLDAAKAAGLRMPIAGGSHVLSFALEPLMRAWGPEALLHGTHFDVRWKAPTEAGSQIIPSARVTAVGAKRIELAVQVVLGESGAVALRGELVVPRQP